ncbi:MAG TPA: class II glutamine amidotransferase [Kofleriaceae bacterium]|nr:class II glutamine amidotransferase [Kofleriaceae bacterium]
MGAFDAAAIVEGAIAMASGRTADHDGSFVVHPDGWGAVWRDADSASGLSVRRDHRPATESALDSGLAAIETDFLAIHVRYANNPTTKGASFTHPLQRRADDWYFMHNGSLPTVYQLLGLERSTFDSAEYFDYLIPAGAHALEERETLARLRAIPPGGNSGNAVAVRRDRAYVIHWRAAGDVWPRYFTMHELVEPKRRIIASEVIPSLAPADRWRELSPDTVTEFRFG